MSVLCLLQLSTSEGRVFWIFSTGFPEVSATFPNHDSYAQFVELALPIALWRAVREGWRSWWYAPAGGFLYASVIGSASRTGTALCTVELLAMVAIGLVEIPRPRDGPADTLNDGAAGGDPGPCSGVRFLRWMGERLGTISAG